MSLSLEVELNLTPLAQRVDDDSPEKPVCAHCHGDEVTFGATAYWDAQHQEFEYDIFDDKVHCPHCDGKQRVEWVPL